MDTTKIYITFYHGNQLFMKNRLQNKGRFNLKEDKDISNSISGQFSPYVILKNTKR